MIELYQAEWCPHSHNVRQRLTELGLDFVARQVPAEPGDRHELETLAGTREIPVLVANGRAIPEEGAILAFLDRLASDEPDADRHRDKSADKVDAFEPYASE